jgi:dienelactone hydrolase
LQVLAPRGRLNAHPIAGGRFAFWSDLVRLTLVAVLLLASFGFAQKPVAPGPRAVNPLERGEKMLDAYLKDQVERIEGNCLTDLSTKEAWEKKRPELLRQFLDMMGLDPLPTRTDLKAVVTGTVEGEGFVVERLHFQSMPGLYVTANFYLPKERGGKKLPTVLYVCGHGNVVEDGISYGSKVSYQYHPAWFATHGYACLILDTLQLGEIQGLHHGTYREKMWWWHARGYSPAAVELWNGTRALDYLETRPEVDAKRIGVTGRSGGGAYSWWLAAADERIAVAVPVAGIVDLRAHLVEGSSGRLAKGVIAGHCDCMYFTNTYRWDFAQVAALIAPRPLLLGNSDEDAIFPVPGYRRLAEKVRKVYALYGTGERFDLLETRGPHKDTPDLRMGINRWMNRWLKEEASTAVKDDLPPRLKPGQLKVFDRLPEGRVNESIHESFVREARIELPADAAAVPGWWRKQKAALLAELKARAFAGWPREPPPLAATVADDLCHDGVRLRAIDFVSETGVPIRLFVLSGAKVEKPAEVILSVLDDDGWRKWCTDLGPEFARVLQIRGKLKRDDAMFAQNRAIVESGKVVFAAIAPRGVGTTRWARPGSTDETHIRRRFALLGQTEDGQRVWDVRRAITVLKAQPNLAAAQLTIQGEGAAAGIALYAGLFEPGVATFDLWHLPSTHREPPIFLNVLRVLDAPQAVALAHPRPVTLHVAAGMERSAWDWPLRLQKALGVGALRVTSSGE